MRDSAGTEPMAALGEKRMGAAPGEVEMVPVKGIEPSTFSLQVSCSTN